MAPTPARTSSVGLLPEARRVVVRSGAALQLAVVGLQAERPGDQGIFVLAVVGIRQATLDGTYGLASLVIVEAHTLRAELRVDHVDVVALADRVVRALGLASTA